MSAFLALGEGLILFGFWKRFGFVLLVVWLFAGVVNAGRTARSSCVNQLRQLWSLQELWFLENGASTNDPLPELSSLAEVGGVKGLPSCWEGGAYTLVGWDELPACSIEGHSMAGWQAELESIRARRMRDAVTAVSCVFAIFLGAWFVFVYRRANGGARLLSARNGLALTAALGSAYVVSFFAFSEAWVRYASDLKLGWPDEAERFYAPLLLLFG